MHWINTLYREESPSDLGWRRPCSPFTRFLQSFWCVQYSRSMEEKARGAADRKSKGSEQPGREVSPKKQKTKKKITFPTLHWGSWAVIVNSRCLFLHSKGNSLSSQLRSVVPNHSMGCQAGGQWKSAFFFFFFLKILSREIEKEPCHDHKNPWTVILWGLR